MNCRWFLSIFLFSASAILADTCDHDSEMPEGWSIDVGGTYTWMSFSTPPTYSGSTGGALFKLTYETPRAFFGQARSYYNLGTLSSSVNKTKLRDSYTEFVGGYCFSPRDCWTLTPYVGLGLDFLSDHHTSYCFTPSIHLKYSIYYALIGLKTHRTWENWMFGLQLDCLPTFNQYLRIKTLPGAAWKLKNRTGAEVQLPISYRFTRNYWLELAPYYRFWPIGASHVLGLGNRRLNQWGAFLTFRFFI